MSFQRCTDQKKHTTDRTRPRASEVAEERERQRESGLLVEQPTPATTRRTKPRTRTEANRGYQHIKSNKKCFQTFELINLIKENCGGVFVCEFFRKSTRVHKMDIPGGVSFDREMSTHQVQEYLTRFKQVFGENPDDSILEQLLERRPDMKVEMMYHLLLKRYQTIDRILDFVVENMMIDYLVMEGYMIQFNTQQKSLNPLTNKLVQECGQGMMYRVIKQIKDPMGNLIYLGKNIVYELNGQAHCQCVPLPNYWMHEGKLCLWNGNSFETVSIDGHDVTFTDQIAKAHNKDVHYTNGKFDVQKRTNSSSSSTSSSAL